MTELSNILQKAKDLTLCPVCGKITEITRYSSISAIITRRCPNGDFFRSQYAGGVEYLIGDVVNIGEMVRKHKAVK